MDNLRDEVNALSHISCSPEIAAVKDGMPCPLEQKHIRMIGRVVHKEGDDCHILLLPQGNHLTDSGRKCMDTAIAIFQEFLHGLVARVLVQSPHNFKHSGIHVKGNIRGNFIHQAHMVAMIVGKKYCINMMVDRTVMPVKYLLEYFFITNPLTSWQGTA